MNWVYDINIYKCLVSIVTNVSDFNPLKVVGRGSNTQLQVGENLNYLISLFRVKIEITSHFH